MWQKYSRMDQVKIVEDSLLKIWRDIVYFSQTISLQIFKGCLPQILLGPFLSALSQTLSQIQGKWYVRWISCSKKRQSKEILKYYLLIRNFIRHQAFQSQALTFQHFFYLLQWKLFKNDEKYFLFHLKSSFCSQDI